MIVYKFAEDRYTSKNTIIMYLKTFLQNKLYCTFMGSTSKWEKTVANSMYLHYTSAYVTLPTFTVN